MAAAKSLLDACIPRDDVLSGELKDEMFAARLSDVVRGSAHAVYQDPEQFFANTYPTQRVQSFMKEVLGRLSGQDPSSSSIFRLDTPFGGARPTPLSRCTIW